MALSEISIIQEALGYNVPLDVIKEIAKFLRYDRYNLRTTPSDGVTRIFALKMRIVLTNYTTNFIYEGDVDVTRTPGAFMFNFTVNGTPWNLIHGWFYDYMYMKLTVTNIQSGVFTRFLCHKFE